MITWLRRNLFRSVWDSILTISLGALISWVLWSAFQFVFINGRWEIIQVNLKLLLVGRFPEEKMWLIAASMMGIAFWLAAIAGGSKQPNGTSATFLAKVLDNIRRFSLLIALAIVLIYLSGDLGSLTLALGFIPVIVLGRLVGRGRKNLRTLSQIPSLVWQPLIAVPALTLIGLTLMESSLEEWGGFLINFYIAIVSIAFSFPLGILLALGRRSSFPAIRLISTGYIELIRGAPLFVLLLLAGVALEFFIPPTISPDAIFRAVTVFTLFTSAYLAEIIRGGLQSIPKGQVEAGKALGLSTSKITFLITLPQALRNVIPAQIGQFISLFKDTTLAGAALNVLELLNIGTAITKQPEYLGQGLVYESLAFVGLLFWVGSYVMSRESQRLEKKLGVGVR